MSNVSPIGTDEQLAQMAERVREKGRSTSTKGGGGGTYDGMSEIVDAKISASEARTDTKFERVIGRLDAIEKSTSGLRGTIIGTGIAAVALVIAVMAYGGQMFGIGLDSQSIADRAAASVESRTSSRLDSLDAQIKALTRAIEASQGMAVVPRETPPS